METFLALAEELHFGRTAQRLRLPQSRVSQQIRSLERRLGAPLFTRTSRRVELTRLGEHTRDSLGAAYQALGDAFDEARTVAQGVVGTLRIGFLGCLNGTPLTTLAADFAAAHPAMGSPGAGAARTYQEALNQVATGRLVWPTHAGLFRHYCHPGVTTRPLTGLPPAHGALVWRAAAEDARIRAFVALGGGHNYW
ncbi:LysR family transcriptional regulator [Kitasatospora acidiphila]|uniref:LysR family transcriptional regulator n=1 Tax=Kitasatospora acidiphila TaxID=2567942 RepID=A0A540WEP9_9ACTN|nr:LysR family transcriptional regulator [Kitasatospora acidiphila]